LRMKFLFNFLILVCLALQAQGQQYNVHGRLTDPQGDGVEAATVVHLESGAGVLTGSNGYYQIELPEGEQQLSFNFSGEHPIVKHIMLQSDTLLNVQISRRDVLLDAVLVSAV